MGGRTGFPPLGPSNSSYMYIRQENRWEKRRDMNWRRHGHGCGRVTNSTTGKEEVVVAGGYEVGLQSSTEIYTVEEDIWRKGKPLPKAMIWSASLPYGDSFLILGGIVIRECQDSIYQVDYVIYQIKCIY